MGKKASKTKSQKSIKKVSFGTRITNRVKKLVAGPWSTTRVVVWIFCGYMVLVLISNAWFYGDAIIGRWDAERTINDPMISQDLLNMNFKERRLTGVGGYSGRRYNPSITNYFDLPNSANRRELFNQIVAEAEKNGWRDLQKHETEFGNFELTATKKSEKYNFLLTVEVGYDRVTIKVLRRT